VVVVGPVVVVQLLSLGYNNNFGWSLMFRTIHVGVKADTTTILVLVVDICWNDTIIIIIIIIIVVVVVVVVIIIIIILRTFIQHDVLGIIIPTVPIIIDFL
jgi:hypothetical protein